MSIYADTLVCTAEIWKKKINSPKAFLSLNGMIDKSFAYYNGVFARLKGRCFTLYL